MKRRTLLTVALAMAIGLISAGSKPVNAQSAPESTETAIFASGCFWCTESDFDKVPGVVATMPGYIGGKTKNPTYKEVGTGRTGHTEALQVTFDPKRVTFEQLLDTYWHNVDPLDKDGQFCDRGDQYRPGIFYTSERQKQLAEASKAALTTSKRFSQPIVVEITKATEFTAAEEYHRDYYKKNSVRYAIYRHGCGRDARLEALWGKGKTH